MVHSPTSLADENILMRVYLRTADRIPGAPTHERLLQAARTHGMAGATILKGITGFGSHGVSGSHHSFAAPIPSPIIVEIVDSADRIASFLTGPFDRVLLAGLVTLERAHVLMYRQRHHQHPNSFHLAAPQRPLITLPQLHSGGRMTIHEDGVLLRIFIGESDRDGHRPLYEAILQKARQLGLAGATVLRGIEGFGANSIVHKSSLLDMSSDLPIIVEIVDRPDPIQKLLPYLEQNVREGMVTMEYVAIVLYHHNPDDAPVQASE